MAVRRTSAAERNASLRDQSLAVTSQVKAQDSWLERTLKPKKVTARYPFKGTALLYTTCGFGSLGDALFGYNSGSLPP
jgi:hypothetical protein